jgi:hypothetical protein
MTDDRLRELYQHALASRSAATRGECPAPERLQALARREGSEEERLRTLDHAMSCGDCMRELELLRVIEKAGARMTGGRAAQQRSLASWRRAVPLALAASLVLAVGLVVRGRSDDGAPGERMRGADDTLVLHTPRDIAIAPSDSLVVAWRPVTGATRFTVEVLDEAGRAVLAQSTADTTLVIRDLSSLTPGRDYRWWVRAFGASASQGSSGLGRLRLAAP